MIAVYWPSISRCQISSQCLFLVFCIVCNIICWLYCCIQAYYSCLVSRECMVVVLCVCERKREISFSVLATAILSVCSKDFTPCQPLKQLSLLSSFLYSFGSGKSLRCAKRKFWNCALIIVVALLCLKASIMKWVNFLKNNVEIFLILFLSVSYGCVKYLLVIFLWHFLYW